ncbi:MAG: hypothetical protein K5750_05450, partial [Eubacterium sp.]|nr:hypothetical protein [Eubacterium sp.]
MDNDGRYKYFDDIQKTYYKNSFESVLRNLDRFKKAYVKTSTSQELLAYIDVLEVRVRDDLNVIKQINLEKDHSLAEAVEKYTEYPNGYSYKDHMAKMKRSVKRSRELNELSKGAAEGSAIKQLSDKIKTLKESGAAVTSDEAKGLDPAGVGLDSEFYNFNKMGLEQNPGLVKNIAALQLIDYIIMNTD